MIICDSRLTEREREKRREKERERERQREREKRWFNFILLCNSILSIRPKSSEYVLFNTGGECELWRCLCVGAGISVFSEQIKTVTDLQLHSYSKVSK